jgi:hypothetical protein
MSRSTKRRTHGKARAAKGLPKLSSPKKQMMEAIKHDLRCASFHEAAHGIVAAAGGYSGTVYLRSPTFQFEGQKSVEGQFTLSKIPAEFAATVAWAGSIAEYRLHGGSDLEEFEDNLEVSPLSSSDERIICGVGEEKQRDSMEEAWALVIANWAKIERLAARCRKEFSTVGSACVDVHPARSPSIRRSASKRG